MNKDKKELTRADEEWYFKVLPTFKELRKIYNDELKLYNGMKEIYENPDTPKLLKEEYKRKLDRSENRLYTYQFAIDMGVKGFILGKRHNERDTAEYKLLKALFGDEDDKK